MNILMITSVLPADSNEHNNIFVYKRAKALAAKGHNIWAIASHTRTRNEGNLRILSRPKDYSKIVLHAITMISKLPNEFAWLSKSIGIKSAIGLFSLCGVAQKVMEKEKIDLIDGHWTDCGGIVAYLLRRVYGMPYIVNENGILAETFDGSVGMRREREVIKKVLDNASKIITVSKDMAKFINKYTKNKPVVIYWGIDTAVFFPRKETSCENAFLSVGTLNKRKNHIALLNAFNMIVKEKYDAKLLIVGVGPEKQKLVDFSRFMNLESRITFIDRLETEKLSEYYSSALAFVSTSIHEGFGIVFTEAEACGCPVIAYNHYAIPEAVGSGGILVQPNNLEEFSQAMKLLLTDKKLRKKLKTKAIQYSAKFSIENEINSVEKIYKSAIKKR